MDWERVLADCVDFTQRLVQTPSMPRDESGVAELLMAEMTKLGFDEAWLDEIGNVSGRVRGREPDLGAIVLNSHLDHVDPGDPTLWPVPPFSAEIVDGRILGRATCDIKGPLAVQVYSISALLRNGERPRRDVVVCGVVQEEIGGAGARHWIGHLDYPVSLIVLGEPSENNIAVGHRGGMWMWVKFHGRSVHASVPDKGVNPNYALARFLVRLHEARHELKSHPVLGPTSVAPTIIEVDTTSANVTPAWARVALDIRTSAESPNSLQAFVHRLAEEWQHTLADGLAGEPDVPLSNSDETITGFYTPPESEIVQKVKTLVGQGMGREPELVSYQFATDGRFFTQFPVIGYSPAEEPLAHTVRESISIAKMEESLKGHVQLLRHL